MGGRIAMKLDWSKRAESELRAIYDYHESAASAKTARKIVGKIYARAQFLLENPQGGQREESLEELPGEYRRLVEGNYKIVYHIAGDTVSVVTVWDCRRDPKVLKDSVKK